MYARAVGKSSIREGTRVIEATPASGNQPVRKCPELPLVVDADAAVDDTLPAVDPYRPGAVDQHVTDLAVGQQWLEHAGAEQLLLRLGGEVERPTAACHRKPGVYADRDVAAQIGECCGLTVGRAHVTTLSNAQSS